jgi:SAM-dependent methyltransferase
MMSTGYGKNWDPAEHYKDIEIARSYDRSRFTSLAGRTFNRLEKAIIRRAFQELDRDAVIVDVPCGTGRLAEELVSAGHRVCGIDISPAMLAVAREKMGGREDRFETIVHDARRLPELGRQFDAALCARVLMHFPLPEQIDFLRGVASISKGRVVFSQGIDNGYHRLRRGLKRLLGNQAPAVYPLTEAQIGELLAGAGLREVRRHYVLPAVSEAFVIVAEKRG